MFCIATEDLQMHWVLLLRMATGVSLLTGLRQHLSGLERSLKHFKQQVISSNRFLPVSGSCRLFPATGWGVGQLLGATESHETPMDDGSQGGKCACKCAHSLLLGGSNQT